MLLLAIAVLLPSRPALAHAILVDSTPVANDRVARAPTEIRLTFSEPLESQFARLTLFDSVGNAIPMQIAGLDSEDTYTLVQPLSELEPDLYTVRWRVVSAADGHGTEGSFTFIVGSAAASTPPAFVHAESTSAVRLPDAAVRWVQLVALALLSGTLAFGALFGAAGGASFFAPRVRWIVVVGWVLYGVALVGAFVLQTSSMRLASVEAVNTDFLRDLLFTSRFGLLWIARLLLWLALGAVLLIFRRRLRTGNRAGMVVAALLLLLQSAQSHAAATPLPLAAVTTDFLHLTLSALWFGGLLALLVALSVTPPATRTRVEIILPFSNYARLLLVGLFLTGIYATWLQVGSLEALITTTYGAALVAKLALMLPLLAIGATNWWMTRNSPNDRAIALSDRLRPLIAAEIALLIGVFAAVGILTTTMPARQEASLRTSIAATPAAVEAPPMVVTEAQEDDLHLHLGIAPGHVGENEFTVTLHDVANHLPVVTATLIRLRFQHTEMSGGENELRITEGTNGSYTGGGPFLSMPGEWRIRATVQRPEAFDVVTDFAVTVESPPPPDASVEGLPSSNPSVLDIAAFAATMLLALSLMAVGIAVLANPRVRLRSGEGGVALLLLLCGALAFAFAALG